MNSRKITLLVSSVALLLVSMHPAWAEDRGYLRINANPAQAYIYADGVPYVESQRHFISLTPGEHKIDIYNYGFKPESRTVNIVAGKLWVENVTMEPIPGMVQGPWGCITIKHGDRAAVLLNGKDPAAFFVGHGDEFNNEFGWPQELIVPPGKQQLTLEYDHGDPWTVEVDVQANKRTIVDALQGVRETVDWPRGEQYKELPHFHAGIASAQVVVEKVSGVFSASSGQINCGDTTNLTWSSTGAAKVELNGQPVSASGNETVTPKEATTYQFTAIGPGGTYNSDATVSVNKDINASLNVTPSEVSNQNNGQPSTATVSWSAPNATSVTLDPIGQVGASGSQQVPVTPSSSAAGPVDQTVTYTLHASNDCGGSETRTASLHLTGENGVIQGAAAAPPTESTEVAQAAGPAELPHTASQTPLVGLIGILLLVGAASIRVFLKISA
jgi:plastocyanin